MDGQSICIRLSSVCKLLELSHGGEPVGCQFPDCVAAPLSVVTPATDGCAPHSSCPLITPAVPFLLNPPRLVQAESTWTSFVCQVAYMPTVCSALDVYPFPPSLTVVSTPRERTKYSTGEVSLDVRCGRTRMDLIWAYPPVKLTVTLYSESTVVPLDGSDRHTDPDCVHSDDRLVRNSSRPASA